MKIAVVALFIVTVAACGPKTSSTPVTTPDGRQGFLVECPKPAACYERISELCTRGYDVLDQQREWRENAAANHWASTWSKGKQQPMHGDVYTSQLVACR